nr:MAG TPA: hypothetical protein [Bacteriophage sp.]
MLAYFLAYILPISFISNPYTSGRLKNLCSYKSDKSL